MSAAQIFPFLAALKKQVPDMSGADPGTDPDAGANLGADWGNAPGPAPTPPAGPIAQQPVSQLPNVGTGEPQVAPEDKGNMFRQPYETKGHALMRILQGGLQGGLSGLSANAQTYAATGRNAGFGGGVAAGYTQSLPFLKATQQAELGQKQAQVGDIQSQTALREAQAKMMGQSIPITLPNGQQVFIPASQAGRPLASAISGGYSMSKADMDNQTKLAVAQIQAGQITHFQPGIDPSTGQPGMQMLDKQGQSKGWVPHAIVPALMMHTSSTVDYKQLDDGSIVALPKTTVTQPVLPSAQPGGGPQAPKAKSGTPNQKRGTGAPVVIRDADGNPLVGKGATTTTTRTMVETAPKVLDLIGRIRGQIDALNQSGDIGPGMSRWNDFWSGKVGTDNPQFRAMRANTMLLSTLLMRMHVGARGSVEIMKHFDDMLAAGHQSAPNMLAVLDQIETYAKEVGSAAPLPPNYGKGNIGGKKGDPLGIL